MTKQIRWTLLALIVAVAFIAIATSAGHHKTSQTSRAATDSTINSAVSTDKVKIQNFMFMPMTIKVAVGTTVTWTNNDSVQHSVTADTIASDAPNGPLFGQGQSYSFKFTKTGQYTFHCMLHPYMRGTVIVTN